MKKVCIVTGTRAEYGLLKPVIDKVYRSDQLELQLVVTGMHLSTEFGLTYREIEEDGYPIASKIEMLLGSDTPVGITKSMGVAMIGFADCLDSIKPDLMVILGDRYEMLVAASAAMVAGIPIAHIHGGELTEGAIDDAIRHSITKMSYLHFTTTEEYRNRVIQLGEEPQRVYNVGSLGVENIKEQKLMQRAELEHSIGFSLDQPYVMVTFHPVTLEKNMARQQFENLLCALDELDRYKIIFTKANADAEGRIINQLIDAYVNKNSDRAAAFTSLGMLRYLSALQQCEMVIGNSSSGVIEAPSFKIPTVNIGNRQSGRVHAASVIDCGNSVEDIRRAVKEAGELRQSTALAGIENPYEKQGTSDKIFDEIQRFLLQDRMADKKFYNISFQ